MKKWIRYYKTIKGELVAEEYTEFGEWSADERIHVGFIDWRQGKEWGDITDGSDVIYDYEEVDLPSEEWLENNINSNIKSIKGIEKENNEFKELLYKHSRGYKVETIIDKITK